MDAVDDADPAAPGHRHQLRVVRAGPAVRTRQQRHQLFSVRGVHRPFPGGLQEVAVLPAEEARKETSERTESD